MAASKFTQSLVEMQIKSSNQNPSLLEYSGFSQVRSPSQQQVNQSNQQSRNKEQIIKSISLPSLKNFKANSNKQQQSLNSQVQDKIISETVTKMKKHITKPKFIRDVKTNHAQQKQIDPKVREKLATFYKEIITPSNKDIMASINSIKEEKRLSMNNQSQSQFLQRPDNMKKYDYQSMMLSNKNLFPKLNTTSSNFITQIMRDKDQSRNEYQDKLLEINNSEIKPDQDDQKKYYLTHIDTFNNHSIMKRHHRIESYKSQENRKQIEQFEDPYPSVRIQEMNSHQLDNITMTTLKTGSLQIQEEDK